MSDAERERTTQAEETPGEETAPERHADTPQQEISQRDAQPREGESPDEAPREQPPDEEEADVAPIEEWHQVPNRNGQGGLPWEELRKGTTPPEGRSPEVRLWDDRGVSKPQQIDSPKRTWDELPEETEPEEEKLSSS